MADWISVEDRLPEIQTGPYLTYNFRTGYFDIMSGDYINYSVCPPENFNEVTHWMPLPAPPTQTGKGE